MWQPSLSLYAILERNPYFYIGVRELNNVPLWRGHPMEQTNALGGFLWPINIYSYVYLNLSESLLIRHASVPHGRFLWAWAETFFVFFCHDLFRCWTALRTNHLSGQPLLPTKKKTKKLALPNHLTWNISDVFSVVVTVMGPIARTSGYEVHRSSASFGDHDPNGILNAISENIAARWLVHVEKIRRKNISFLTRDRTNLSQHSLKVVLSNLHFTIFPYETTHGSHGTRNNPKSSEKLD